MHIAGDGEFLMAILLPIMLFVIGGAFSSFYILVQDLMYDKYKPELQEK